MQSFIKRKDCYFINLINEIAIFFFCNEYRISEIELCTANTLEIISGDSLLIIYATRLHSAIPPRCVKKY